MIEKWTKTVLITGGGGPAVPGMIEALQLKGFRVVTVDMMEFAAGYFFSDAAYVVPAGNAPGFFDRMSEICDKESVDAIVSVVDEELSHVAAFESQGIAVIQPQKHFIELALDKYACMKELRSHGISAPETWLINEIPEYAKYPLFLKPRTGRGSRGCLKVEDQAQLERFLETKVEDVSTYIAQRCINGLEYTVSVVVWRDGIVNAVVPKEIISKIGVTRAAVTRESYAIDELCRTIQSKLKANGPFNVQLILDDMGVPWVFEINPRLSTSTTLTCAAGVDELGNLVSQALFGDLPLTWSWKPGIVLIRKSADHFLTESDYSSVAVDKFEYRTL
jgi:carbamoyl-phosphate synthase large subunit